MPFSGKLLRFGSPLQVEPKAEMAVAFTAKRQKLQQIDHNLWYGLGLFAGLSVAGIVLGFVRRRWDRLHEILTPAPRPIQPTEPADADEPSDQDKPDEPDDQVSADELI